MSLTEGSQKKQVVGIILVVIFLLTVFVYGTRGYRASNENCCAISPKKIKHQAETCQAGNNSCPLETPVVR